MNTFQLLVLLTVLSSIFTRKISFGDTSCTGSKKELIKVITCESNNDKFWAEIDFIEPLDNFMVLIEVYQKRGNKYFQFYKAPKINWCELNNPHFQLVSLQKFYIQVLSKSLKGLFHPCPFKGRHRFDNVSFTADVLNIASSKSLKIVFGIADSNNYSLFTFNTHLILTE